jgi:pyruvate dehydrogenase E2 component (dihydrolipoamide acetyltransferase)
VKVGDKVSEGTLLVRVEVADVAAPPAAATPTAAPPTAPANVIPVEEAPAPVAATSVDVPSVQNAPASAPAATNGAPKAEPEIAAPVLAAVVAVNGAVTHAGPAIRRFARELGVDLAAVRGTGPNGRVTRDDVQNHVRRIVTSPPLAAPSTNGSGAGLHLLPWPKVDFERFGPVERKALTRIQKISGPTLARNWAMIPHVTQHELADVTETEVFRTLINTEQHDVKVTMLAIILKASAAALKQYPIFNSSLDGDELVLKQYYHIGFAADTPNGLLVPVIRDVDTKGILELALETQSLAKKAREGKLSAAEMSGATFTISSLGGIGGTAFTPIINAPEVAILGVSRSNVAPVWNGTAFLPRTLLPLSLSYDHRVIDGAAAARFCVYLAGILTDIRKLLL